MAISTLITALETLIFSKVGIDWIGIVMLSGLPLVLNEVISGEWQGLLLCASTWEYEWAGWMRMAGMVAAAIQGVPQKCTLFLYYLYLQLKLRYFKSVYFILY